MKKKKLLSALISAMMVATLLCGCGNMTDLLTSRESTEESEESSESNRKWGTNEDDDQDVAVKDDTAEIEYVDSEEYDVDTETMELIKYNVYIELNNYIVEVLDNIDYYFMAVDYDDEFSLLDSGYSYGYNIYYLDTTILEDAEMVASMTPAFEGLDEMTKDIIEPTRTMMEVFNEIDQSSDYADNQYEKAKEYHEIIMANADTYYEMGLDYLDAVDAMADASIAEDEAKMLENGELIIYNSSHAITVAEAILDECYEQGIDDYNLEELDLEPIRELYDELVATVQAYDAAVSDKDQLIKESMSDSAPFDGLLDSLVQSVEWMITQVESGEPVSDPELSPLGSVGHVHEVLSQCIDRYNVVFTE